MRGYRVNSLEGVRFRRWATCVLREMLLKRHAADGLIEMTNPASPNSPQHSYRLTSKGYAAVA